MRHIEPAPNVNVDPIHETCPSVISNSLMNLGPYGEDQLMAAPTAMAPKEARIIERKFVFVSKRNEIKISKIKDQRWRQNIVNVQLLIH